MKLISSFASDPNMFKKLVFIIMLSITIYAQSKVIIWDLGNTLFGTSYMTFAYNIGFFNFITYMIIDFRNPNVKPIVFDIMQKINPSEENLEEVAADDEGNPLPVVMNRWLAGLITGKEALKSIHDYVNQLEAQNYFVSRRQKRLVLKTLDQMFNPDTLVAATYPIMDGIALLDECFHAKNSDGSAKNVLFVLSNWDDVSFEILKTRYAEIFDKYFDKNHVIISGAIGLIKPKKEAFAYVLNTYKLNPKECIFIDDQYDNILAAEDVGITSLLMCKGNYKTLRNILVKLDALPPTVASSFKP